MGIDIKTLCYEIDFCTGGARVRRTALPFLRFLFLSSSFSGLRTFGNSFLFRMDPPYPLSDQKPEVDPGPRRSVGRWPRRFGLELCLDGADRGLVAALPPRGLERSCPEIRPTESTYPHPPSENWKTDIEVSISNIKRSSYVVNLKIQRPTGIQVPIGGLRFHLNRYAPLSCGLPGGFGQFDDAQAANGRDLHGVPAEDGIDEIFIRGRKSSGEPLRSIDFT